MQGNPDYYFELYTQNPDRVSLMVAVNGHDELLGRALIWKLDNGREYMDRVYGSDHIIRLFRQEAENRGMGDCYASGASLFVPLSHTFCDSYPYMDSFSCIVDGVGLRTSYTRDVTGTLNSTCGVRTYLCSECHEEYSYLDEDNLCDGCQRSMHCSHCGERKEDRDDDYCWSCTSDNTCRHCDEFDSSTDESGYCSYCRPQHTCMACGDVAEEVDRPSEPYCDDCRPDHTCGSCLKYIEEGESLTDDLCETCFEAATNPEED
jgi:hypothetical protein